MPTIRYPQRLQYLTHSKRSSQPRFPHTNVPDTVSVRDTCSVMSKAKNLSGSETFAALRVPNRPMPHSRRILGPDRSRPLPRPPIYGILDPMDGDYAKALSQYVSDHKLRRFDEVARNRTRHLTVVLEDVYQAHNASACLRSCECFGIQDVHVIENRNRFQVSRDVALGAAQWLNVLRYDQDDENTSACLRTLKERGYRIVATSPQAGGVRLDDYDVRRKTALLFGNELDGLSEPAFADADEVLQVPTYGFTESLNLSVTVAVCLHHLAFKLRRTEVPWQLTEQEQVEIKARWAEQVVQKHWKPLAEKLRMQQDAPSSE